MEGLLEIAGFLSAEECSQVVAEMRNSEGTAAPIYGAQDGGKVIPAIRKVTLASVSHSTIQLITQRLADSVERLARDFAVDISTVEPPQFLHYRKGDHFVAHQDGNTSLIPGERQQRRVSIVIFVNPQDEFSGGMLTLHGRYPDWQARHEVAASTGKLVAFRPETTHEVTAVTAGERFAIASWLR